MPSAKRAITAPPRRLGSREWELAHERVQVIVSVIWLVMIVSLLGPDALLRQYV